MSREIENMIQNLSSAIVNTVNDMNDTAIEKAQFDKSYKVKIYGVNQVFTSDFEPTKKQELIEKYNIPETVSENQLSYFTVKFKDIYYVIQSEIDFSLYENAYLYIPNNDWSRMYLDKISESSSSGGTGILDAVEINGNELYYNNETYYLQFGYNKRIMCVTHGDNYHICQSMDRTESLIEAVTAVLSGLKDDWDCEFDLWITQDNENWTPSSFFDGSNTPVPFTINIDGIEDIVIESTSSQITTLLQGVHRIKAKFPDDVQLKINLSSIGGWWSIGENNPLYLNGIGSHVFVNNKFNNSFSLGTNYTSTLVSKLCFGENLPAINQQLSSGNSSSWAEGYEFSIPPKIVVIGANAYKYVGEIYVYIPKTTTAILNTAFEYANISEIEISKDGNSLFIGNLCFDGNNYVNNNVNGLFIPKRVNLMPTNYVFDHIGLQVIQFEKGVTSTGGILCGTGSPSSGYNYPNGNVISQPSGRLPVYIIIPDTVTSISNPIIPANTPHVEIFYAGASNNWENISKNANWNNDCPDVVMHYSSQPYYKDIMEYVKKASQNISTGDGLSMSNGIISLKTASNSQLGGVMVGNGLSIDSQTKILKVDGNKISFQQIDITPTESISYTGSSDSQFSVSGRITQGNLFNYESIKIQGIIYSHYLNEEGYYEYQGQFNVTVRFINGTAPSGNDFVISNHVSFTDKSKIYQLSISQSYGSQLNFSVQRLAGETGQDVRFSITSIYGTTYKIT